MTDVIKIIEEQEVEGFFDDIDALLGNIEDLTAEKEMALQALGIDVSELLDEAED